MEYIGKGLATIGIWAAIAYMSPHLDLVMIPICIAGFLTCASIWES